MKKFYLFLILLYSVLIFYLSSIPQSKIPQIFEFKDIVLHFIEYSILGFLFSLFFTNGFKHTLSYKQIFFIIIFVVFYAITDEYHQKFVPSRVFSYKDMIVDFLGGIFSIGVSQFISKRFFD